MRIALFALIFLSGLTSLAQINSLEDQFLSNLKTGSPLPEKLLSTRTAVFYTYSFTEKELLKAQESFQRTGVDAIIYLPSDYIFASKDVSDALADYLNKREITNLVFLQKKDDGFSISVAEFNTKPTIVEVNQYAWAAQDKVLSDLLTKLFRATTGTLKKQNLLINDVPEMDAKIEPIRGRRSEAFAIDMKVDPIAIPKFNDEKLDAQLESFFATYPYKYKLTDPKLTEKELRKQGFYYVLSFINARDKIAKDLMGYNVTKAETGIVSVTFPNEEAVLKTYDADEPVFKFYVKHIDSQNTFLGTKWDADLTWQAALHNHLKSFKTELKIP